MSTGEDFIEEMGNRRLGGKKIAALLEEDARSVASSALKGTLSGKVLDPRKLRIPSPRSYAYSPQLPARRVASHWPAFNGYLEARDRYVAGEGGQFRDTYTEEWWEWWSPLYDIGEGTRRFKKLVERDEETGRDDFDAYVKAIMELCGRYGVGLLDAGA